MNKTSSPLEKFCFFSHCNVKTFFFVEGELLKAEAAKEWNDRFDERTEKFETVEEEGRTEAL